MEGVFRFKSWFLNAPGLIQGGAYYWNLQYLCFIKNIIQLAFILSQFSTVK